MENSEVVDRQPGSTSRWAPVVRVLAVLAFFGVVGGAVWVLQGGMSAPVGVPRVGTKAPNFTLESASGQRISLSEYQGKTVILNFWATWCPPCRSEMPAIDAVAKANPKIVVLAVDLQEGPLPVRAYAQQFGLSFSPLLDTSGQVTALYHVDSLPSSFFIGPDGIVRAVNVGAMDQRMIDENLKRAT